MQKRITLSVLMGLTVMVSVNPHALLLSSHPLVAYAQSPSISVTLNQPTENYTAKDVLLIQGVAKAAAGLVLILYQLDNEVVDVNELDPATVTESNFSTNLSPKDFDDGAHLVSVEVMDATGATQRSTAVPITIQHRTAADPLPTGDGSATMTQNVGDQPLPVVSSAPTKSPSPRPSATPGTLAPSAAPTSLVTLPKPQSGVSLNLSADDAIILGQSLSVALEITSSHPIVSSSVTLFVDGAVVFPLTSWDKTKDNPITYTGEISADNLAAGSHLVQALVTLDDGSHAVSNSLNVQVQNGWWQRLLNWFKRLFKRE